MGRQTKVLILKSITTLNDATVTRILEKSDWNLRRAIEAFYIAKYKTQEYLTKKEKNGKDKGAKGNDQQRKREKKERWHGGNHGKHLQMKMHEWIFVKLYFSALSNFFYVECMCFVFVCLYVDLLHIKITIKRRLDSCNIKNISCFIKSYE